MKYTATSRHNRHFEVFDESGQLIGRLDYNNWLNTKAEITTLDNNVYEIEKVDFWLREMNVTKNGELYAEVRYNMLAGVVITFANGAVYTFKRNSIWQGGYILVDRDGYEIASVDVNFHWSTFSFTYEIDIPNHIPDHEMSIVLPCITMYCTSYVRMKHARAAM